MKMSLLKLQLKTCKKLDLRIARILKKYWQPVTVFWDLNWLLTHPNLNLILLVQLGKNLLLKTCY